MHSVALVVYLSCGNQIRTNRVLLWQICSEVHFLPLEHLSEIIRSGKAKFTQVPSFDEVYLATYIILRLQLRKFENITYIWASHKYLRDDCTVLWWYPGETIEHMPNGVWSRKHTLHHSSICLRVESASTWFSHLLIKIKSLPWKYHCSSESKTPADTLISVALWFLRLSIWFSSLWLTYRNHSKINKLVMSWSLTYICFHLTRLVSWTVYNFLLWLWPWLTFSLLICKHVRIYFKFKFIKLVSNFIKLHSKW